MRSRDLQAGRKERKEKEDVVTMSGTPLRLIDSTVHSSNHAEKKGWILASNQQIHKYNQKSHSGLAVNPGHASLWFQK